LYTFSIDEKHYSLLIDTAMSERYVKQVLKYKLSNKYYNTLLKLRVNQMQVHSMVLRGIEDHTIQSHSHTARHTSIAIDTSN